MNFKIINQKNQGKIEEAFKKCQGRAMARTIDFYDLEKIVEKINKKVEKLPLKKKELEGLKFWRYPETELPKSYKYHDKYMDTCFMLLYKNGTWRIDIDSIVRCNTGRQYLSKERAGTFLFTDEQKEVVVKRTLEELKRVL